MESAIEKRIKDGRVILESFGSEVRLKIVSSNGSVGVSPTSMRGKTSEQIAKVLKTFKNISSDDTFNGLIERFADA